MRHQLTTDEKRKGGWARARQIAAVRRYNPTPIEKEVRELVSSALPFLKIEYEYEFWNDFAGFPQFFDIYIPLLYMAIEIDGSRGWHDHKNMKRYDDAKRMYCNQHMIVLIKVKKNKKGLLGTIGNLVK